MNDRSVRMVMFGALLAALVACGLNSQSAKTQSEATGTEFASADDLGPLLDGQPAPLQPGFAARDESSVMPMDLDVMTYAGR